MNAEDYKKRTGFRQGHTFEAWNRRGFICVDVLTFLNGKPWDDYALGAVHALRPSWIRVVPADGGIQMDAQVWRVTVWLTEDGTIGTIDQEVEVGLPDDCRNGGDLDQKIMGDDPEPVEPNPEDEPR